MAGVGPQVIQVLDFANSRAPELQAIHELSHHELMHSKVDEKLVIQQNQRRRRANAFKSHQMPRRLRQNPASKPITEEEEHIELSSRGSYRKAQEKLVKSTAKVGESTQTKCQHRCRKHTRRVHNLISERSWLHEQNDQTGVNEESLKPKLLPTHAFHAKRMLMKECFGHVLAQHRQDKSISATLSAVRKTAVVHDASYLGILELYGSPMLILEALHLVMDPLLNFMEDTFFLSGQQERQCILYHSSKFPLGAISPVTMMWCPSNGESDVGENQRQLWLWIHPATFMEAATAIASAISEVLAEHEESETIDIRDRRGHLSRFEVRGSNSLNDMLTKILRPNKTVCCEETPLERYLHDVLVADWRKGDPTNTIYGITAQDPRAFPTKMIDPPIVSLLTEPKGLIDQHAEILCPLSNKVLNTVTMEEPDSTLILDQLERILKWTTSSSDSETSASDSSNASYPYLSRVLPSQETTKIATKKTRQDRVPPPSSLLFSFDNRQQMKQSFRKDHERNMRYYEQVQQRRKSDLNPVNRLCDQNLMHLLVIKKRSEFHHTSGWDFVITNEYAPAFLNALAFAGAMVIGLDEREAISTIDGSVSFPRDFPDTNAGHEYWHQIAEQQHNELIKKPKAKRVPYTKLGVISPFQPDWKSLFSLNGVSIKEDELMKDATDEEDGESSNLCVLRGEEYMKAFKLFSHSAEDINEMVPVAIPTLIRVIVKIQRRGTLEPSSILYVPNDDDVIQFVANPKWMGYEQQGHKLDVLGFVTSAVYDRPTSTFRAIAFCSCETLQQLFLAQRHTDLHQVLALSQSPTSRVLRPVYIHVLS